MGFGKPLGPYKVAFADFELRPGAQLPKREVPEESDYVFVPHEKDVGKEYADIQTAGSDSRKADSDSQTIKDLEANARRRPLFSQASFEEEELRMESDMHQRLSGSREGSEGAKGTSGLGGQQGPAPKGESVPPPLVRFWYPTQEKENGSWFQRRWLPDFYYAVGFANVVLWEKTLLKRTFMYMAGGKQWQLSSGFVL